jgi:hypothetical protein
MSLKFSFWGCLVRWLFKENESVVESTEMRVWLWWIGKEWGGNSRCPSQGTIPELAKKYWGNHEKYQSLQLPLLPTLYLPNAFQANFTACNHILSSPAFILKLTPNQICWTFLSQFRSLPHTYRSLPHTYRSLPHTYRSLPHTYRSLPHTYRSLPHTYRSLPHTYRSLPHTYRSLSHTYRSLPPTYRSLPHTYRSLSHTYRRKKQSIYFI